MANITFEKRSLGKKYLIVCAMVGFALSLLLCFAKQVTIKTILLTNSVNIVPVVMVKSQQQTVVTLQHENVFQISFPFLRLSPLSVTNFANEALTQKVVISDLNIKNVFGGSISFHGLNITTRVVDFLTAAQFLAVNVNAHFQIKCTTS